MTETQLNRMGHPSPLIFHLGAAVLGYQSALAVASKAIPHAQIWQPELQDQAASLHDLDSLRLCQNAVSRLAHMSSGVQKWQSHPYRRTMSDPDVIWSDGSSRLLDYGTCPEAVAPEGPPILIIPSMINRAYILDLYQECSFLRFLASQGLRPLLLDWGEPTGIERDFDLETYVKQRFLPAMSRARSLSSAPIGLLGYCMGGTLAAGILARHGEGVAAFATIGSPWDFDASTGVTAALQTATTASKAKEFLDDQGRAFGMIPTAFFQNMFAMINPMQAAVKFRKFDQMDQTSVRAQHFVALEDWLADGVPLVTQTAKDLLVGWNVNNDTAKGTWSLLGGKVDLKAINQATLCVCGTRDSITQLGVATALPDGISGAVRHVPDAGHVGMVVGSKAKETVWRPISDFFASKLL